jgi:hypothetical protein
MSSATQSYSIRNHAALAQFARKFVPAINQEAEAPVPPSNADFFGTMRMSENVEVDSGSDVTIDVQPDFRFLFGYIAYYVSALYPELNVKGHPYASSLSYVGYCLLLVFAHVLACDLSARRTASSHALVFRNDSYLKDYFNTLLQARIPSFLIPLIEQLAPLYDPRRNRVEFVPTLAGFSFGHDFGRTIVPSVFLSAHDQVASTRQNEDPADLVSRFYGTNLVHYGSTTYKVGNILGTHYNDGTRTVAHPNWLNEMVESIYNPVVGRFLTARPTFARIPLKEYSAKGFTDFNPYIYALSACDENITKMQDFVNAMSRFVESEDSRTFPLGSLLQKISGNVILNHSIEPPTLPTWTAKSVSTDRKTGKAPSHEADNKTFATTHSFLVPPTLGSESRKFPADSKGIETPLYLVDNESYNSDEPPITFDTFDPLENVIPYVRYFQPYDVSPQSLGYTVALGIKIESGSIDGITIPLPDSSESLDESNTQFLQGSIRLNKIQETNTFTSECNVVERQPASADDPFAQAIGISFRNAGKVVIPRFATDQQDSKVIQEIPGTSFESNHASLNFCATATASASSDIPNIPDSFAYLWSSYRFVHKHRLRSTQDISMFSTFRHSYGLNVTLSRSKNPVVLLPK